MRPLKCQASNSGEPAIAILTFAVLIRFNLKGKKAAFDDNNILNVSLFSRGSIY